MLLCKVLYFQCTSHAYLFIKFIPKGFYEFVNFVLVSAITTLKKHNFYTLALCPVTLLNCVFVLEALLWFL